MQAMTTTPTSLTLELLTWISNGPRTYAEAMEAWRSNCPRHAVWEDACIDGLVQVVRNGDARRSSVVLTTRGRALLSR
jgi:hypothetical protein